jgi:hypothetical protein
MDRGDLLLTALGLLCLAGLVLGVGGVTLLKRDRASLGTDDTAEPSVEQDITEER